MSARREAQSNMPGLAEPRESGRSVFGPGLTPPPRPINVAAALFMPIPGDNAPRGDGHDVHIHGGTFYEAQNIVVNQQHYYPDTTSAPAGASVFRDSTHVLRGWTNRSLWISPQSISSKRTAKTGRVFVSRAKYKNWRTAVNGVFWASGKPGAGKTYLACAAFDEINASVKDSPNDSCTVIYLKHNDQWTTWDIVSFIITDLVESKPLPAALEAIRETLRKQRTMGERPSLSDLIALLHKIVKLYSRCYILIDGLDEMKVDIQVELIEIIAELGANVMLTSRPLNLVQDQLAKIALTKPVFTTVAAEKEDLKLYIDDTIKRTPTFASLLDDSFPKEQLIQKIQTNADGMFLHAMLQMEVLRHCIDQEELLQLLDQFPPGLKEMYADAVRRIERQPLSHVLRAKTALVWLVHANGSMTIDDLRCATATVAPDYRVEPKRMLTEDNLLTICCGLVTVDAKTRQARLIHDTAREALGRLLQDHCPKPQAMMATACLTRLVEFEFHQPSVTNSDELQAMYAKVPLLRYAHLAVQHHVRKGVEEEYPSLLDRVEQFTRQCSSFPYLDPLDSSWGIHGLNAIHVATLFNQQVIVEKLLDNGAGDINTKTLHELGGITPLAIAALEGFNSLTQYLLTVPNIHPNNGDLTPLMCAAMLGRDIIVEQLLSHFEGIAKGEDDSGQAQVHVEVNRAGRLGRTALAHAAFEGHAAVVKLLLGVEGVDVNKGEDDGWTPVTNACQEGHIEVVKLLLSAPGIDVNQTTKKGTSPLFIASQNGHVEVVKLLLSAPGIDVNQANKDGASPLFMASQQGYAEVVKLLLSAPGIDVNQAMNDGASSLFQASQNGHVEVLKLLLSTAGIDVNQQTNKCVSPLIIASDMGHKDIVKVLLAVPGINITHEDSFGDTALTAAYHKGHGEIVQLLTAALDREAAPLDPTSNAPSNETPEAGQLTSPMAASPHAPSPARQSLASPLQPANTIPNVPDIGGGLPQATSSHSPRPGSPSLDPLQTARPKRKREGARSPSPPPDSTSEQDERTPKRPRIGGSDGGTTHSEGPDPGAGSSSLPPAPVASLVIPPAPPVAQSPLPPPQQAPSHATTSGLGSAESLPPPTLPSALTLLNDPQDETTRKRQRQDIDLQSPTPASPAMDASQDELRAPKRPRVGSGG